MKILITNSYSLQQKGDSTLLSLTIKQLSQAFPDSTISAQIMQKTAPGQTYEGVRVMDSLSYVALAPDVTIPVRLVRAGYVITASLAWALVTKHAKQPRRLFLGRRLYAATEAIFHSDLVVPVAGGYLASEAGLPATFNLTLILLSFWLAAILEKPVIGFPQSVGPLGNKFQTWLVKQTLKHARLMITREAISADYLEQLAIPRARIYRSIDAAFLFAPPVGTTLPKSIKLAKKTKNVGITTKVHLPKGPQQRYEAAIAQLVDWLAERGYVVWLIPQITSSQLNEDDRVINRRIYELTARNQQIRVIDDELTNEQTKQLISEMDYLVGTRFHSVIFALSSFVPSLAIEYEHKTSGIMRDLELERWVIDMSEVTFDQLRRGFSELEIGRDDYVAQLQRLLPGYTKRAEAIPQLVRGKFAELSAGASLQK